MNAAYFGNENACGRIVTYQYRRIWEWKRKRAAELVIANRLAFKTKKKSAAELINAIQTSLQSEEKIKRAAELIAAKRNRALPR
jgi:hypothetical protein